MANAAVCSNVPANFPTSCEASCTPSYSLAGNYVNIDPGFLAATCGSNQCCVTLGDGACAAEAKKMGFATGACKAACGSGDTKSLQSVSTCTTGKVCCFSQGASASGSGCVNIAGVTSACKAALGTDEFDAFENSTFWSPYYSTAGCQQKCAIKRDAGLCKGLAKLKNLTGDYGCYKSGDCEKPLSSDVPIPGGVCGGGQECCIAKAGAAKPAAAAKPGSPVTLPDPLSGLNFPKLLGNIIRTFSGIVGAIALLMFVYGGIMWILSGGSPDKVKSAQKILVNASIGLVLIFGAYTFVSSILDAIIAAPPGTTAGGEGGETAK
ncbi:MAG TPA: pilin [Candidatus Methylomirabilis sp.]|nr:pilin [Candidatus Methylomirabilis sp.]